MRENGFFLSLPGRLKSEENEVVAEMFSGKDEVDRPAGSRALRKRRAEFGKDEAGGEMPPNQGCQPVFGAIPQVSVKMNLF